MQKEETYVVEATGSEAKHITELLQAEAQGRLLTLPITDNQTVYAIVQGLVVSETFITEISKSYTHKDGIKFYGIQDDMDDFEFDLSDFGKTVFTSRTEAEKALK